MTRRERMENRLEKRRDWAEKAARASDSASDHARTLLSGIPLGQPILIGHHSERGHRAYLRRTDGAMSKAVERGNMAQHHNQKADGLERALDNSIFSDDPDAIEALEAKIAKLQEKQEFMKAVNRIVKRKKGTQEEKAQEIAQSFGISETTAHKLFVPDFCGRVGFPSYALQNNNGNIQRLKGRITEIEKRNAKQEAAEVNGGVLVQESGDWCAVTFAEKPDRAVIDSLKASGFYWAIGSWTGKTENLPPGIC